MATTSSTDSEDRRTQLLAMLQATGVIRLTDAADQLSVSTMTVRRDLDGLAEEGLLRRVRGGAVSVIGPRPFDQRRAVRLRAKETIADKALALVPRVGSIAFDGSTTVGTLAYRLGTRSDLTVTTNSYYIFATLTGLSGVRPVLTGGEPEQITESLVGPIAVQAAEALRYQRFFVSGTAIDSQFGTTEVSLRESAVKRAFGRMSKELVLCIDSSKLQQQSTAACLAIGEASLLITELPPSDPRLDEFRELIEVW